VKRFFRVNKEFEIKKPTERQSKLKEFFDIDGNLKE